MAAIARHSGSRGWQSIVVPYLYLAPFLVLFVMFRILPLIYGLYVSVTNLQLGTTSPNFVGVANFTGLASDTRFQTSMLNTGTFTLEATLPVLGLPLLLAVILNRGIGLRTTLRSVFFFPVTLSVVTVGLVWAWLLDPLVGPFTYFLQQLGLSSHPWLGDSATAMWAIVIATVWSAAGYYLVIYLAALQDIPTQLLEAAALDGATGWQGFWSISFPLLRPVILFVVVIHIIGAFQIFGLVYVMTNGGPADATLTIVQYIYLTGFQTTFDVGVAAAISWVLFAVILIFSLIQFRLFRERAEY